jgi:hypothetical protein
MANVRLVTPCGSASGGTIEPDKFYSGQVLRGLLNFRGSTKKLWKWSGRKDLNLRPPGPEPGALARLRYAPTIELTHQGVYARMPRLATRRNQVRSGLWPYLRMLRRLKLVPQCELHHARLIQ